MSSPSYIINIDSEYRNTNIYTNPTDFSVKLITPTPTNPPVVYGAPSVGTPISSSSTGAVNTPNSFLTPVQIDPDFYNVNFSVINGKLTHVKQISTATLIFSGIINNLTPAQNFKVINTAINTTYVNLSSTVFSQTAGTSGTNNVFLGSLTYSSTTGAYYLDWFNYSDFAADTGTSYVVPGVTYTQPFKSISYTSTFVVDLNNVIYWMFDYNAILVNIYNSTNPIMSSNSGTLLTSVSVYNSTMNSSLAGSQVGNPAYNLYKLSFQRFNNTSGYPYNILDNNTSYLQSFCSNLCGINNTSETCKPVIRVDSGSNIYIGFNINPNNPVQNSYPLNFNPTSNNYPSNFQGSYYTMIPNKTLYPWVYTTSVNKTGDHLLLITYAQNTYDNRTYYQAFPFYTQNGLIPSTMYVPPNATSTIWGHTGASTGTYNNLFTYNFGDRSWAYISTGATAIDTGEINFFITGKVSTSSPPVPTINVSYFRVESVGVTGNELDLNLNVATTNLTVPLNYFPNQYNPTVTENTGPVGPNPLPCTGGNYHTNAVNWGLTSMFSANLVCVQNPYPNARPFGNVVPNPYIVTPVFYSINLNVSTPTINSVTITRSLSQNYVIQGLGQPYVSPGWNTVPIVPEENYYIYPYIIDGPSGPGSTGSTLYVFFKTSKNYNTGAYTIPYVDVYVQSYTITSATTLTFNYSNAYKIQAYTSVPLPLRTLNISPYSTYGEYQIADINQQFVAIPYTQTINGVINKYVLCSFGNTGTVILLNFTNATGMSTNSGQGGGSTEVDNVINYTSFVTPYANNIIKNPLGVNQMTQVIISQTTTNVYAIDINNTIYDITDPLYPVLLSQNFSPNPTYVSSVSGSTLNYSTAYSSYRSHIYINPNESSPIVFNICQNTATGPISPYSNYSINSTVFPITDFELEYYNNNNQSPSTKYNVQGWGSSIVVQLTPSLDVVWTCGLGTYFSSGQSCNVNISGMALDNTSGYLYVSGVWQNSIIAFNHNTTLVNGVYNISSPSLITNKITSSYGNPYQDSFVTKISISDGGIFKWLMPIISSFYNGNIIVSDIDYINTTNNIIFTTSFKSINLVLYSPQISSSGTFKNPSSAILNVNNSSISSASFISITSDGALSFNYTYFTSSTGQTVDLYGLYVEENASNYNYENSIKVIGLTSSNLLLSTDLYGKQVQTIYGYSSNTPTLFSYSYTLKGTYVESHKTEIPASSTGLYIGDIISFSRYNTVINWFTYTPTISTPFYIFNKDGTLGGLYTPTVLNYSSSFISVYYYDSSFVDINTKHYSQIKLINYFNTGSNFLFNNDELYNYDIFIQGSLSINSNTGTRPISVGTTNDTYPLNTNFTIRYNITTSTSNTLVLNQLISIKDIKRTNLSCSTIYDNNNALYWAANIGVTPLPSVITFANNGNAGGYQGPTGAGNTGSITVLSVYGQSINTSSTGNYLVFPGSTGTYQYVVVTSISYSTGSNSYTVNMGSTGLNSLVAAYPFNAGRYYPNIYLTSFNINSTDILPWNPQSSYQQTYYTLKLNSLSIPNRAIYGYISGSTRSINDFEYVVLEIWNTNDQGTGNSGILNNVFTNNRNFVTPIESERTKFQIPVSGININSNNSYTVLTALATPTISFATDYNNISIRLVDPYDNIIFFDSSYNPNKADDLPFINSSVDQSLMQLNANFTFTLNTK